VTRTQHQIEEVRTGEACIEVRDDTDRPFAGIPVWVEQESHAFVFGCVAPDLAALSETDRQRCQDRLGEVFNLIMPTRQLADSSKTRFDVPDAVHMSPLRLEMDRLSSAGRPVDVWVRGRAVGLGRQADDRVAAERLAALYSLCFAHPAVRAIYWERFWDGEPDTDDAGLLRLDFSPKPAFRYLQKLIATVWHSRASGQTDSDGRFTFRGFFGDYRVGVQVGAGTTTIQFSHRSNATASRYAFQVPAAWV